jgi:hypothetical protein
MSNPDSADERPWVSLGAVQEGDCLGIHIHKLLGLVLGAIIVTAFILLANSPLSAQETKPDFADATTCSCYIQTTTDNLGKLNGYLVRLDIQYQENQKPRWNHPVRMYRIEDRKKAGEFCISMYKKYFQEEQKHYEALQKQAQQEAASRPNHQTEIKKSLAPTF